MQLLHVECIKRGVNVKEVEEGDLPVSLIRGVISNFSNVGCQLSFSHEVQKRKSMKIIKCETSNYFTATNLHQIKKYEFQRKNLIKGKTDLDESDWKDQFHFDRLVAMRANMQADLDVQGNVIINHFCGSRSENLVSKVFKSQTYNSGYSDAQLKQKYKVIQNYHKRQQKISPKSVGENLLDLFDKQEEK